MSKPIPATPTLYGKDAEAVLDEMVNGTPSTPERIATIRRADEMYAKYVAHLAPSFAATRVAHRTKERNR